MMIQTPISIDPQHTIRLLIVQSPILVVVNKNTTATLTEDRDRVSSLTRLIKTDEWTHPTLGLKKTIVSCTLLAIPIDSIHHIILIHQHDILMPLVQVSIPLDGPLHLHDSDLLCVTPEIDLRQVGPTHIIRNAILPVTVHIETRVQSIQVEDRLTNSMTDIEDRVHRNIHDHRLWRNLDRWPIGIH